jgi:hypothetical protein
VKLAGLRIEMESDADSKTPVDEWRDRFMSLSEEIAGKIEQFSSKAEAELYRNRGNITRRASPSLPKHQLYIDLCIFDLDHLRQFITDFSRGKERH